MEIKVERKKKIKWFAAGLDKEALTKRYRELAKEFHPDISQDPDAEEKMKEINAEYDEYFTLIRVAETGYNVDDIQSTYGQARTSREIILAFLRKDKKRGTGFFAFNYKGKIVSDASPSWQKFHGGFAVCKLSSVFPAYADMPDTQTVSLMVDAQPECPSYADMYFGLKFGDFWYPADSAELADKSTWGAKHAYMWDLDKYVNIHSQYGDAWVVYRGAQKTAYMKAAGRIMDCRLDLKPEFYTVQETVPAEDFGYLAFQDCTKSEFCRFHDVDVWPKLARALDPIRITKAQDMYWVDDPIVAHFARTGIVCFWRSRFNHRMRFGCFSSEGLRAGIHRLSIEDAEHIQDYLDRLNGEFDATSKQMARKGKIRISL